MFLLLCSSGQASAELRFPPPDFTESGHRLPATATPPARTLFYQYLDVAVLAACLSLATWLVHKNRSRRPLVLLSIFALAYFGFYRKGCVCSIGSLQNVSLALFDRGYALPLTVLAFFLLPLVFALFAGRTFCAAVCPHGAIQDLVLLKPQKLPAWLDHALSLLPYFYLGAAVLFAATGSMFIVCQYDPFVPMFRLSGRTLMVLAGIGLLALGMFFGRPYCRWLCPYGALLKVAATVSRWRIRVTPNVCTQCRLCENSCPFGALDEPDSGKTDPLVLTKSRQRLGWLLVLLPALILSGGWLGSKFSTAASRMHPTVSLVERYVQSQGNVPAPAARSPEALALSRAGQAPQPMLEDALRIRSKFRVGGWLFGAWVGLVIGVKLISLSVRRTRLEYQPDSGACLSCARCFEYCPNELARRGLTPATAATQPG